MSKLRLVIDTNIWVSIFIGANFENFLEIIFKKNHLILSSTELIDELAEVLTRSKFKKYLGNPIENYVEQHKNIVKIVKVKSEYFQSPDPNDNFLFDIAIQKKAEYIVTGDKKLLEHNPPFPIKIITLKSFREL